MTIVKEKKEDFWKFWKVDSQNRNTKKFNWKKNDASKTHQCLFTSAAASMKKVV